MKVVEESLNIELAHIGRWHAVWFHEEYRNDWWNVCHKTDLCIYICIFIYRI